MTERRETRRVSVSTKMTNLDCVIGKSTSKPNTITMGVDNKTILEAAELYDGIGKEIEPQEGLLGYELFAVYGEKDEVIDVTSTATPEDLKVSADEMKDDPLYKDDETPEEKIESMTNDLDEVLEDGEKE